MTEPLPEKLQVDLNYLRDSISHYAIKYEKIDEQLAILVLNAYNLGKDPSYEMIPIP